MKKKERKREPIKKKQKKIEYLTTSFVIHLFILLKVI